MLKRPAKILLAILLTTGVSALLSGCLVEKKDPASIDRYTSTDPNLRTYQPNDQIDYQVIVYSPSGTQTGTLTIKWESTGNLIEPINSTSYPVLKETTTLTINDGDPDELVRYVEQDANGSMYLRAFDTSTLNEYYWLSENNAPTTVLDKFEILRSPFTAVDANPITLKDFYTLSDCNGTNCPTREAFSNSRSFQLSALNQIVDTPAEAFANAYQAQYNGTINREATAPLFDILDVCSDAPGITFHEATLYIVPEIGIVKMENNCAGGTPISSTYYTIEMVSTTISY